MKIALANLVVRHESETENTSYQSSFTRFYHVLAENENNRDNIKYDNGSVIQNV